MIKNMIQKKGKTAYPGLSSGKLAFFQEQVHYRSHPAHSGDNAINTANEIQRLNRALTSTKMVLNRLMATLSSYNNLASEDARMIMESHLLTLKDPMFINNMQEKISLGMRAEEAVNLVADEYISVFSGMEEEVFRDKRRDIEDIKIRLSSQLGASVRQDLPPGTDIVWAVTLRPQQVIYLHRKGIRGIILNRAAENSHEIILMKALQIPSLFNVPYRPRLSKGETIPAALDAEKGTIYLNPEEKILEEVESRRIHIQEEIERRTDQKKIIHTASGEEIKISMNLDLLEELKGSNLNTIAGVGLFRTEFLLLANPHLSEYEQVEYYTRVFSSFPEDDVVIRLFDIGGDKNFFKTDRQSDENFLGLRSIRYLLKDSDLLKTQIRAILKANKGNNAVILLPMISIVEEVERIRAILTDSTKELNVPYPRIGVLVETPAAIDLMPFMNPLVDFYSVGTNDLLQYNTAADRTMNQLSYIYHPLHEGLWNSLERILANAQKTENGKKIPVSICGELPSRPEYLSMAIGLGYRNFSIRPSFIYKTKEFIQKIDSQMSKYLLEQIRRLPTLSARSDFLQKNFDKFIPPG